MSELHNSARRLLETKTVNLIIGFQEGRDKEPRPVFIDTVDSISQLIFDERCVQNLAVYLSKPEVITYGKIGIVATPAIMRSLLQLAAENQIREGEVILLTILTDGKISEISQFSEIEAIIAQFDHTNKPVDREKINSAKSNKGGTLAVLA